jgi:acyl carrier protein
MKKEVIVNKIFEILNERDIIQKIELLDLKAPLQETYGLNSINFIDIIVSIEEMFDLEFDDDDLDMNNFNNIDSIIQTVLTHLDKKE